MNKLDISSWKEFKIAELFITETSKNKLQVPTGATIARKDLTDGDIPRITVTNLNNGIIGYYKNIQSDNYRVHENFISVSFLGTIFYHPYRASLDMKVHCLKLKEKSLNHYIALFLIGIIKKQISYFAYNDQLSSSILPELSILLPVKNNQPDWEYMESYVKWIYSRERGSISIVKDYVEKSTTKRVDITKWGTFQIGELFEIKKPEVIHSKNVQECNLQNESDSIPYVVRTKFNNGIKCNIIKTSEMQPTISGVISFGAENTVFFYQKKEFVSGRDIYYIDTSYLSKNTCLFLVACLNTITHKYSYNNGLFPDLLRKENISLPITNQNTPDWKYMEDYISCLFQQQNNGLQQLV